MVFSRIPKLKTVMTPFPHSIDFAEPTESAVRMMEQHAIRHLPVTRDGELVGVVSESDLRVARALSEGSEGGASLSVGVLCSKDPYVVDLEARLDEVAVEMAGLQIGSALVTRHGHLAGILTTTDVCRILGELLRENLPPGGGDAAA
ncbi:MAG: CBS domain-containing protein [Myxococcales bacterium]